LELAGTERPAGLQFSFRWWEFNAGRCLIIADGFYEFTDPADKKKKRKDKWLFTKRGEPWLCIAGIWRANKDVGEAFTMLTMDTFPTSFRTMIGRSPLSIERIGAHGSILPFQRKLS
jgi:hypothetical protein